MGERERYVLANTAAETMYYLWELEDQKEGLDPNTMMCRLKDLSAYALTHAEIMEQREVVELLALGMYFGASSDPAYHKNQERLRSLSEETVAYKGRAEVFEEEVATQKGARKVPKEWDDEEPLQPRLL